MVAYFIKKTAAYRKNKTDGSREKSITEERFEGPITEDSKRTLSLRTKKRTLSPRNLKKARSLRNLKRTLSEDPITEDPQEFIEPQSLLRRKKLFWLFGYSI